MYGWSDGSDVITNTKISGIDGLQNFVTHGGLHTRATKLCYHWMMIMMMIMMMMITITKRQVNLKDRTKVKPYTRTQ